MAMPPQLAKSKRRRPRHSEPRPTIELMPHIDIHELRHAIPRYHGQVNEPDVSFKYPDLAYLRLSTSCLEIRGRNGYVQRFRIVWISISEIHNLAHLEFLPIQQIEDQSLIFTEAER